MSKVSKISNTTPTASVQKHIDTGANASSGGVVSASNAGVGVGSPTSNPFSSPYYYKGFTGYKCGAKEIQKPTGGIVFPEKIFHIDLNAIEKSDITFQSEKMKNISQYETNQVATNTDTSTMEGDV